MSKIDDGGPAFPLNSPSGTPEYMPVRDGMSLRDWFAGQALVGCTIGISLGGEGAQALVEMAKEQRITPKEVLANICLGYADAMIAARSAETEDGNG